jgi:hypothetical protein
MASVTVTVCDHCLQASCWQGLFYCDDYQTAGTVEKTIEELTALGLEHPSYWGSPSSSDNLSTGSALSDGDNQ